MNHQEVVQYIAQADTAEITDILDAAMERYRILYPHWDILYYAAERGDTEAPARIADFLNRLRAAE